MAKKNIYVERVCTRVGERDHTKALALLVRRYTERGDSLTSIAGKLGVSRIVEEKLPFEGGIFKLASGETIIKLNSYSPPARRRFTLAHEVGHLLLSTESGSCGCVSDQNLERACDLIAAELLMPAEEMVSAVSQLKGSSPQELRTLARKFQVSWYAAARRVHQDLGLWKRFIGLWKWDGVLKECWFVGRRPWGTLPPEFAAFKLAQASSSPIKCYDTFRRDDHVKSVSLELQNTGKGCILGLVEVAS